MAAVPHSFLSDLKCIPTRKIGDFELRLETEELSPEVQEVARRELRESPEVVKEALAALRELLGADDTLTVPLDNDFFLIKFLRPCKFFPDSAYALMKRYYEFKVKHSDMYDGLVPSRESNVYHNDVINILPRRDQCGRRIVILELGKKWNHRKVSLDEIFKGCVILLEAALNEPETQVCGGQVVFDMEGLSLQQVWQFTPPFAKRIIDWLQESLPLRLKGFHVVNQPYIFNMVFALFKPFLKDKLRSRIIFHGTDRDSLHSYISPKNLPERYGGTLKMPHIPSQEWYKIIIEMEREYEVINSYGCKVGARKK